MRTRVVVVGEALEGHRRDQHRRRHLGPQHRGGGGDLGDVDQHPRAKLPLPEGLAVCAQRPPVAGPTSEVTVGAWLQPLLSEPFEVCDVDGLGDEARL